MKLVKSLLLGSAAGLAATTCGQAADLPFRKAAPVEYVRVCDWTGAGYFYIPGTDTCLRIGGFVRAEYSWQDRVEYDPSNANIMSQGAYDLVNLSIGYNDARNPKTRLVRRRRKARRP